MTDTKSSPLEQTVIDALGLETAATEPVGAQLRAAREAANLSIRQVAEGLYLLPNQVEALETGNYKRFRAEIFSRGYLRAYAKFLDLDDQAIVDGYVKTLPQSANDSKRAGSKQNIQNPVKGRSVKYWFLALAAALTVTAWWLNSGSETVVAVVTDNAEVIVDNSDGSLGNNGAASEAGDLLTTSDVVIASVDTGVEGKELESTEGQPPSLNNSSISAEAIPLLTAAQGTLEFSFTADCWVEIRNGDNKLIFADLKRARDTLTLQGKEPFTIVLGYAPGATLSHNGAAVTIDADARSNAAEFVVTRS